MKNSTNQSLLAETDSSLIRAELERLLSDRRFSGARQMSAFLRYIVSETLDGNGNRIKAYTVGVDALGKADDFDAQADPSVRVLALRLRKSLEAAYADDTECHARIVMSVGSYVPEFYKPHSFVSHDGVQTARQTLKAVGAGDTVGMSMKHDLPNEPNSATRCVAEDHDTAACSGFAGSSQRYGNWSGAGGVNFARAAILPERMTVVPQGKWVWAAMAVALLAGAWQASTGTSSVGTTTLEGRPSRAEALRIVSTLPFPILSTKMSD